VATVSGTAPDSGDVLILSSTGISEVNNRVAVASDVSGSSVTLLGIDATDADVSEPGQSTLAVASDFVDFNQEGDVSTSGGDQQFWTGQFLEDRSFRQISVPTYKNAKTLTLPLYFDPSLPWYAAAKRADRNRDPIVLRCRLPDGDAIYWYGYLSFDADPTLSANNPMQNTATFTALGDSSLVSADDGSAS